jgi:hypothetical protein
LRLAQYTETVFKIRVTPHAVGHSVGNFIVARAPEGAALAGVILNHRGGSVTPNYLQRADQVMASRRFPAPTEQYAANLAADDMPLAPRSRKKSGLVQPGRRARRMSA